MTVVNVRTVASGFHRNDFYEDPRIYDILHTPGTACEVDGLQRITRRYLSSTGGRQTWFEPACGTGRYLRVLANRGVRTVGFDGSSVMVNYAKQRLRRLGLTRRCRLFVADMVNFATPLEGRRVDFAFNLINTIRHLPSDRALLEHFAQMAEVLTPTGIYAVGISLSQYGHEFANQDRWKGTRGRCRVSEVVRYDPPDGKGNAGRREQVIHRITVKTPRHIKRFESNYFLRCYNHRQWRALLRRSPFEVLASVDERGTPIGEYPMIYQVELLRLRG